MKLELILPRELYLTGETIDVDIELTNTGKTAVDAPTLATRGNTQPDYRLQGPAYPQGVSFNFHDIHVAGEESPAAAPEPATHHLEAGGTMATGFSLTSIKPIAEPGEYNLSAKIDAKGWSAQAAPVKFRVEKARFVESSLGIDINPNSARSMRAVWIAESAGGRMLGETFLYEKRPDLGEVIVTGTRIIRKVGAGSTNAFVPWTNYDRISAPKFWHGWREGAALLAFSDDEGEPRYFDMGSPKSEIVQPTFMNRAGDLEALVLSENRRTLRLVRFPAAGKSSVAWSLDLPEEAAATCAGIDPKSGLRIALYAYQSGLKVAVRLIRVSETAAQVDPPMLFDEAFLLPDSTPSLGIEEDGTIHASLLFARHPGLRSLGVGDLTVAKEKKDRTVTFVGRIDSPALHAWTAHNATGEGPATRRWLIQTVQRTQGGGSEPITMPVDAPAVGLLRMFSATYLLELDPNSGPHLVAAYF
jgi:hypothetical protein